MRGRGGSASIPDCHPSFAQDAWLLYTTACRLYERTRSETAEAVLVSRRMSETLLAVCHELKLPQRVRGRLLQTLVGDTAERARLRACCLPWTTLRLRDLPPAHPPLSVCSPRRCCCNLCSRAFTPHHRLLQHTLAAAFPQQHHVRPTRLEPSMARARSIERKAVPARWLTHGSASDC